MFFGYVISQTRLALVSIQEIIDEALPPEAAKLAAGPGSTALVTAPSVAFANVSFAYDGTQPVLDDVSFTAPAGSFMAIVGPSGSGKSTLLKLLLRLYEPCAGSIHLDGRLLHTIAQDELRQRSGYVTQDARLFDRSLLDNLVYGHPSPDPALAEMLVERLGLSELATTLEHGMQTRLGENAGRLSGGEKQRVAIARAIARDSKLILFDEPTAALDAKTEQAIMATLARQYGAATRIVLAHRLSSIQFADQILVMNRGRLVERGSHAQLLRLDGLYAELWWAQYKEAPGHARAG
jgi:ATP-binding cassette subfamily B protein